MGEEGRLGTLGQVVIWFMHIHLPLLKDTQSGWKHRLGIHMLIPCIIWRKYSVVGLNFFSCFISLLLYFWDSSYTYVRPFGHVPLACYALLCFPFLFLFVLHLEIFCPPVFEFITSLFCCVQSSVNAIHWVLNFRCYILQLENLYLIFLIDFNLCWNSPFYSFWPTFSSTFSSKAFEC